MHYRFHARGHAFYGRNVPGDARVRIHRVDGNAFFVAFDPQLDVPSAHVGTGIWSDIPPATDLSLLPELAPQVIAACDDRFQWYRAIRAAHGKPIEARRPGSDFDANYLLDPDDLDDLDSR